jgi:flagellar protein FlaG
MQAKAPTAGGNVATDSGKTLPVEIARPKPDMQKIAKMLNMAAGSIGRNLRFKVNLDAGTSVIEVLDRDTGEIVRQIPPEKVSTYLQSEGGLAIRLFDEVV